MANPQLKVDVLANLKQFNQGMNAMSARLQKAGEEIGRVGQQLTTRLTAPLAGIGAVGVKAFDTQIKAQMKLKAAIQANGGEVDKLFKQYATFARELQKVTTVGDETTLQMIQQAESMGLSGESAMRAAKNAIALASANDMSAKSAIRYTAALEEGDATMLSRYIPTLRSTTDMAERAELAQERLASMFDVATAEAQAGLGPLEQLKNSFGDLMEEVGEVLNGALVPLIKALSGVVETLQEVDQRTKAFYIGMGLIVAGVGPALLILSQLVKMLSLTQLRMLATVGSILALVIAFKYVVDNAQAFKTMFTNIFIEVQNMVLGAVASIIDGFANLLGAVGQFNAGMAQIQLIMMQFANTTRESMQEVGESGKEFQSLEQFIEGLKDQFAEFFGVLQQGIEETFPEVEAGLEGIKLSLTGLDALQDEFVSGFSQGFSDLIVAGGRFNQFMKELGKTILKSGIGKLISGFLTGGLTAGAGFFGKGGGLFGKIFGGGAVASATTPALGAIPVSVEGQFQMRGSDLVATIQRTNSATLR